MFPLTHLHQEVSFFRRLHKKQGADSSAPIFLRMICFTNTRIIPTSGFDPNTSRYSLHCSTEHLYIVSRIILYAVCFFDDFSKPYIWLIH